MKPTYEELLQRARELETRNQIFESIVQQAPFAILITDFMGRVETVNENYHKFLGYDPDELTDEFMYTILPDDESVAQYNELKNCAMRGEIWRGEFKQRRKDGKEIWVRQLLLPLKIDGQIKHYILIFNDITDEKVNEIIRNDQQFIHNTLLENLPHIIAIYDTTGNFFYANEHTDNFFRMPKGGVTGKNFREIFPPPVADEQEKNMLSVITSKSPLTLERSMMMHGQMNYFKAIHQPLLNDKGEVKSILVIGQNITSQVQHEKLLKIQHQIDSLSNLTTSLNSSLKKAFSYLLEIDWIDVGGIYLFDDDRKHLRLVFSEGLSEDYLKAVSVYTDQDPQTKLVLKKKSKFANTRTFLKPVSEIMLKESLTFVVAIPLIYKKEVIGSLNVGSKSVEEVSTHDKYIIESIASRLANLIILVKTREELIASNLRLNRSVQEIGEQQQLLIQKSRLESLGELSAGLAHEINQPLSVISLVMENINFKMEQNSATPEYLNGKFSTIIQNINKIRKLIDHVRIFSRDQGTIMFERVDVNQVITDALSMIEAQLRSHQINLVVNLTPGLGYTLGNPARFEQVILNLVSNARDALDEKEKMANATAFGKEIVVTTFMEKDRIYITIRDNGSGISKENQDKIFNPFFTTKLDGKGTGLGLAIVYGIIREMKGDISVVSEEMAFTEIRLKLKGYKNQQEHSNSS